MDTLAGYIGLVGVSVAATYFSQFLRPKIKIRYWFQHNFMYTMPWNVQPQQPLLQGAPPVAAGPAPQPGVGGIINVLTHSVTVQNFGRKSAEWVEIVHQRRPEFFQLFPPLDYLESTTPAGEHVLRVKSIAPKEWFTIQFLSFLQRPELLYVRSPIGHASLMPWVVIRQFPAWLGRVAWLLVATGSVFYSYWLIRAGIFLFKLMRPH